MTATLNHLADGLTATRLTLHVLAAAVWVGGQITMLGLVGPARGLASDAPATLARAFNRLAWPAFFLLLATGLWNAQAVGKGTTASVVTAITGVILIDALFAIFFNEIGL